MSIHHAVHFGVSKLGQALNGLVLSQAGFQVTMVNSDEQVVELLRTSNGYEVNIVGGEETRTVPVKCTAMLLTDPALIDRLCECDVITTNVGVAALPAVAERLATAIRERSRRHSGPAHTNVLACESLVRATTLLWHLVADHLSPEEARLAKLRYGFPDCGVDRIVPGLGWAGLAWARLEAGVTRLSGDQAVRSVVTEEYFEWVVDAAQVRGSLAIPGVQCHSPLQPYISRCMFLRAAGHLAVAYHGHLRGHKLVVESMADPEVEGEAREVMREVARILEQKYGFPLAELHEYVEQALVRFKNPRIKDSVAHVGRDPLQRLQHGGPLIKPLLTTIKFGIPNPHLCRLVAAALRFYDPHDAEAKRLRLHVLQLGPELTLKLISQVSKDSPTRAQLNMDAVVTGVVDAFTALGENQPLPPVSAPEPVALKRPQSVVRAPYVTTLAPVRKDAVHFGAGNIGRGFIGQLLAIAGYAVTFADVNEHVVHLLHKLKSYEVHVVGATEGTVRVVGADALHTKDPALLDRLATCELITTAVGVNVLPRVAPLFAQAVRRRREAGVTECLNVIACENAVRATTALKACVWEGLTEEDREYATKYVGFADSAVDRIVPSIERLDPVETQTEESELAVIVEEFFEWDVDQTQLRGEGYLDGLRDIDGITLCDQLSAYVERKLFTLNTGHAITAYLGFLRGHPMVYDSILDPSVAAVVRGAMAESGAVLQRRHGFDPVKHGEYIDRIMTRFQNPFLRDDVNRVGRDPVRKLGAADRLIAPLLGTLEYGLPNVNLCRGVAAALRFAPPADPQAAALQELVQAQGVRGALANLLPVAHKKLGEATLAAIEQEYEELGKLAH